MKIEANKKELELGHKAVKFRIGEEFQAKAMWALINLYQDKIGTPVKEIISNARDANRENNRCDSDIDIELSNLELSITDHGKGMSPELMENVVTNFGSSTKTGTNELNGGFGIGMKSPLCRVNQFKVDTRIDGIEYNYIIAKNGDNLELNLISQNKTNKPTGTTVRIPMKFHSGYTKDEEQKAYKQAVINTVLFWEKRPRFNYTIPEIDLYRLTDNSFRLPNKNRYYRDSSITVVIDGMFYKYSNNEFYYAPYDWAMQRGSDIILKFNTGDIKIHETRERIEPTEKQLTLIKTMLRKVDIEDSINANNIKNLDDYLTKLKVYPYIEWVVEGIRINRDRVFLSNFNKYDYKTTYKKGGYVVADNKAKYIPLNTEVFFVDTNESVNLFARRAKAYALENKCTVYVVTQKTETLQKLFKYRNISELPLPEIKKRGKLEVTSVNYLLVGPSYTSQYTLKRKDFSQVKWLYLDYTETLPNQYGAVKFTVDQGYKLVKLSKANQEALKDYENIISYHEYVDNFKLTQDHINWYISDNTKNLSSSQVLLSNLLGDNDGQALKEHNEFFTKHKHLQGYILLEKHTQELHAKFHKQIIERNEKITQVIKNVEKRFPLMYDAYSKDETIFTQYINAMVNFEKLGEN